jgi:hypothetical protein
MEAHVGFPSKEAYAAAQIQASYRGRKARKALEQAGIPIVLPEERKIMMQLEQADSLRDSAAMGTAASDKRKHQSHQSPHRHHRRRSADAIGVDDAADDKEKQPPSFLARSWTKIRRILMTLTLVFFSYSNLYVFQTF